MIKQLARGVGLIAAGTVAVLGAATPANAASATGSKADAAAAAADTQAPTAPTNLVVEGTTARTVTLVWTWATDNVDVVDYQVTYNGTSIRFGRSWARETLYGLTPGTRYTITVAALDAAGNLSAPSAPVTATTVTDNQAPTAPTNFVGQPGPDATFGWTESTDNSNLIIYTLYLDGNPLTEVYNQNFAYVPDLELTGTHTMFVRASDEAGNTSEPSNTLTFTLS